MEQRFWGKVAKGDCWEWVGGKDVYGYGTFRVGDKIQKAHRVAWVLNNGTIPDGLFCLHKCNNRGCVNPDHLYLGTNADNMRDMVEAGNQFRACGEKNMSAKLTWEQVDEIRSLRKHGYTQQEIADIYKISRSQIGCIVNNVSWCVDGYSVVKYNNSGERNGRAKLNFASVEDMRRLYFDKGLKQDKIAQMFGISKTHVSQIVCNKRWAKHVETKGGMLNEGSTKNNQASFTD